MRIQALRSTLVLSVSGFALVKEYFFGCLKLVRTYGCLIEPQDPFWLQSKLEEFK